MYPLQHMVVSRSFEWPQIWLRKILFGRLATIHEEGDTLMTIMAGRLVTDAVCAAR